jgi:hypothetical protein
VPALDRPEARGLRATRVRDCEDQRLVLVEFTDRMQELYGPLAEGGDMLLDDYSDGVLRRYEKSSIGPPGFNCSRPSG